MQPNIFLWVLGVNHLLRKPSSVTSHLFSGRSLPVRPWDVIALTFLAPYGSHNGSFIEDTADNHHFEGTTGLPAVHQFNARQKHKRMCALTRQPITFSVSSRVVLSSRVHKWFWMRTQWCPQSARQRYIEETLSELLWIDAIVLSVLD